MLSRNWASSVVALVVALGTKIVEILATQDLVIHGMKASKHAQVSSSDSLSFSCEYERLLYTSNVFIPASVTTTTSVSGISASECPKCGSMKKSGTLSCCARGGAWFNRCGDLGDSNFDHTWIEGIQACKNSKSSSLCDSFGRVSVRIV